MSTTGERYDPTDYHMQHIHHRADAGGATQPSIWAFADVNQKTRMLALSDGDAVVKRPHTMNLTSELAVESVLNSSKKMAE